MSCKHPFLSRLTQQNQNKTHKPGFYKRETANLIVCDNRTNKKNITWPHTDMFLPQRQSKSEELKAQDRMRLEWLRNDKNNMIPAK